MADTMPIGSLELEQVANVTVATCGFARTAVLAPEGDADRLAAMLRLRNADVEIAGSDCSVVVGLFAGAEIVDEEGAGKLFTSCRDQGVRYVLVSLHGHELASPIRESWEGQAVAAGFRKHPCYYVPLDYEQFDEPTAHMMLLFERMDERAYARFPLQELLRNRMLHMDMLREVGRRGDAHCIRYHKAAEFVRPGDAVLDLACGYGYGSYVIYHNSPAQSVRGLDLDEGAIEYARGNYEIAGAVQFAVGNAQQLDGVPDASIDFIVSFETIEHLPEPDLYLDELRRVLRPGGRVMLCAPNDWSDETGEDPNPHHLHVYTWQRLRDEVGARFLLERGFVQTAGGAMKCHHAPRDWAQVSFEPLARDAEWILLLAMASPSGGEAVPYAETSWQLPKDEGFHVAAFARDYTNPWLVKAIVSRGMRMENPSQLAAVRATVLGSFDRTTADYGAALCGEVYAMLSRVGERCRDLEAAADAYIAIDNPTPHQLRWQVSLLFVAGELALRDGDRTEAKARFEACAAVDVAAYSPLLGNKTVDARLRLAAMSVVAGDHAGARENLTSAIAEVRRLTSGSWLNVIGHDENPLPFGLPELAELMDRGSQAAYALAQLEAADARPGLYVREVRGYFERRLAGSQRELLAARRNTACYLESASKLDERCKHLVEQLHAKEARLHELGGEVSSADARAQELARQVREADARQAAAVAEHGAVVRQHQEELARMQPRRGFGWLARMLRKGR